MSSDVAWRWADPAGQQRLVREDELRAALVAGVIPPNAPVWRGGWKDWQPAYAVPELTTSALAAANGVVPNIPPPPLGVLGAQRDMENEATARAPGATTTEAFPEPPPPPRYVPAPTRMPSTPGATGSQRSLPSPPASSPNASPAASPAPPASSPKPEVSAAAAPPHSPDATQQQAPASERKVSIADESNTGVTLPALSESTASDLLSGMAPNKAALATAVGVPAMPASTLAAAAASTASVPPPAAGTPATSTGPARQATAPPPMKPKTSKPPPPPAASANVKKSKTLILYGAPTPTPASPASERQGPPINVPAPSGGESPQAITRPPPADGAAQVTSPPPPPPPKKPSTTPPQPAVPVEELSQSILVEDRDAEGETDSIILSDSVRRVSSTFPPKPGARSGTLLGFPVPTPPLAEDAAPPPPPQPAVVAGEPFVRLAPGSREAPTAPPPPLAPSKSVHDLRVVLPPPRAKHFWPMVGGAAALLLLLVVIVTSARRGASDDDKKVATAPSGDPRPAPSPAVDPTSTAPAASMSMSMSASSGAPAPVSARACSLGGASHTIAPRALVPTGVEVQPSASGIGLGFATTPKDAMTVEVDPSTLTVAASARVHSADALKRVVPEVNGGKLGVVAEADKRGDVMVGRRTIPGRWPVDVGVADASLVWSTHLGDAFSKLWSLDADAPVEALRGIPIEVKGEAGFAIAFRKAGAIWMGAALGEKTLTPRGPLFRVAGLGPVVGSPTIASSGESILIAWADRASAAEPWGLRWVKFTPGQSPREAVAFRPPPGGLGEHAMSPSLAAVGGGRFLFTWTEGPVSAHQVRAQTLSTDGAPLGDAFVVSADGVNAGQAQAAVQEGGRGVVAFLAAKGKAYEVVATPIVCAK